LDNLLTISGVRGYVDAKGTAYLKLEDVARGLGFTDNTKGLEYVKWDRVRHYLSDLAFSTQVSKDTFIPESIFYRLAMKARNTVAETFQAKVAEEILPTIRKHGMYATDSLLDDPDLLLKTVTRLRDERAARLAAEAIITEQAPKVEYHDQILTSEGTITVSQIAKDYAIIAQDLNLILKHEGVQYKSGKQWLLTAKYQSQGFTDSYTGLNGSGFSYVNSKWTQTGRLFIHQLLARKGIRPGLGPDSAGEEYIARLRQAETDRRKKRKRAPRHSVNVNVTVSSLRLN